MKKIKAATLILLAAMMLCAGALAGGSVTVETLLEDMLAAFAEPSPGTRERMDRDAEALDDPVLREVAESWKRLYLDPKLQILYMQRNDPAELNIPDPAHHAFVVLGYCLKDGKMAPELEGRCEAAAAAARAYPESILICTGGETGLRNPNHATEAGEMAGYLIDQCGIGQERLYLDTEALTTADNAVNAFEIMKENGIRTMTLVTSGYHLRWARLLFDAVAAWNREQGSPIEITGNWCYYTAPAPGYTNANEMLAISQLRDLLLYREDAWFAESGTAGE